MSTREKFLKDFKELSKKYGGLTIWSVQENGVPVYGQKNVLNNLPNAGIIAIQLPIPGEDTGIIISGKEILDYLADKTVDVGNYQHVNL